MWISHYADINVGIISTLWMFNPLMMAFCEWYIYSAKLNLNHLVSLLSLILCMLCIYFSPPNNDTFTKEYFLVNHPDV